MLLPGKQELWSLLQEWLPNEMSCEVLHSYLDFKHDWGFIIVWGGSRIADAENDVSLGGKRLSWRCFFLCSRVWNDSGKWTRFLFLPLVFLCLRVIDLSACLPEIRGEIVYSQIFLYNDLNISIWWKWSRTEWTIPLCKECCGVLSFIFFCGRSFFWCIFITKKHEGVMTKFWEYLLDQSVRLSMSVVCFDGSDEPASYIQLYLQIYSSAHTTEYELELLFWIFFPIEMRL